MTKEALKLALEALEADELAMIQDKDGHMVYLKDQAITAIKAALEAKDGECKYCTDGCPACDARKLPEQEPVAFVKGWNCGRLEVIVRSLNQRFEIDQPLYTTPSQRTWVGLKDKEIEEIWKIAMFTDYGIGAELSNQPFVHYARAIEAKLKEKNHG